MNERILITGAAGFIGSNLADDLLQNGFRILAIDNFDPFYKRSIKETHIKEALKNPEYQFEEGDIRDPEFMGRCFKSFKPDVIIHLAAKAGVRPSLHDPHLYFDVNVMGTLNVLDMMKKYNLSKMIFASSSSVYGNNMKVPFAETDNVDFPISPYASSKKSGELLCHTFHHLYDFDVYCLRFFTVYGPRQRPDLAIHKFIKAILEDDYIYLYGDGTTSRDYTYIDDIINGIKGAIKKVKGFEVYNLGDSRPVQLSDLITLIEKSAGRKARLKYMPQQEGDVTRTFADISKARRELGYNPNTDIESGIKKYFDWFKAKRLVPGY
jgi:UDP-glucuronate 4-epimerase